jgi:hypothetical protein
MEDGQIRWQLPVFLSDDQVFGYHQKVFFHVWPKTKSIFQIDMFKPGYFWGGKPILTELKECASILEAMRGCQDFADRYKPEQLEKDAPK